MTQSDESINYADFAGEDDGPIVEAPAPKPRAKLAQEPVARDDDALDAPDDDAVDGPDEPDDDRIDELDVDDETDPDDGALSDEDLIEIDEDTKLTKAEIKELAAKKEEYAKYSDELRVLETERTAVAEIKRTFEDSTTFVASQYNAALQVIANIMPPEPSIELMVSNPQDYVRQKQWRDHVVGMWQQVKTAADAQLSESRAEAEKAMAAEANARATTEAEKLLKAVPQLRNAKKAEGYLKSITDAGKRYGYTADEVRSFVKQDHRAALLLRKAALYDASVASKKPSPETPRSASIPIASRARPADKRQLDNRKFTAVLDRAVKPNSSRPQSLREIGAFFNDD